MTDETREEHKPEEPEGLAPIIVDEVTRRPIASVVVGPKIATGEVVRPGPSFSPWPTDGAE